jgi:hypothetical protein
MTEEKKSELRGLLQDMRKDLYNELDKRLSTIESQLNLITEEIEKEPDVAAVVMKEAEVEEIRSDIIDMVSEDVESYIVGEITEKLEEHITTEQAKSRKRIIEEIRNSKTSLRLKSVVWGMAVVAGGWLTWYGAWGVIGTVPLIQEPRVAFVAGIVLLLSTGVLHKKLVG